MTDSPYAQIPVSQWATVTQDLLNTFPIKMDDLVKVVFSAWTDIFESAVGRKGHKIGQDILPQPQIMGFFLHELIPLNLEADYPLRWKRGNAFNEFDACYIPDDKYSFEIKTSSSVSDIFGNRSYTHISAKAIKKRRSGFMLTINFDKFEEPLSQAANSDIAEINLPKLKLIRFGWLEPSDWLGQAAQSGQQAKLTKEAKAYKLKVLWETIKPAKKVQAVKRAAL